MGEEPDFGPGGHLPERASRRARKIVLRAPMGVQWILGAIVAGVIIVAAGVLWLATSDDPPGPPWVAVADVDELGDAMVVDALDVLVVATGRPRAFAGLTELGLAWCDVSGRIEGTGGQVWSATGRAQTSGTASLAQHPTLVVDGALYVDPSVTVEGPDPQVSDPAPACSG